MTTKTIPKDQKKRFADAAVNFGELEKILAPFIRPRKIVNTSTQGQWQRASNEGVIFTREVFQESLRKVIRPVQDQPVQEK